MTHVVSPPTRLRAIRDTCKRIRQAEFPWTSDTAYLNNASIGPIPERTRAALEQFNAKRTAPHLLPDPDMQGLLQSGRDLVGQLIHAEPGEVALAPSTRFALNLAATAPP